MSRAGGRRRRARELALRVLFEIEGTDKDVDASLEYQAQDTGAATDVAGYARQLVVGTLTHLDGVDSAISGASENWDLIDLGKVERAVLRMGAYEVLHERDTPVAVCIDESIELTRIYAGEDAVPLVNGVLGRIARERV